MQLQAEPRQLTFDKHRKLTPVWTPNGQQITYSIGRYSHWRVTVVAKEGASLTNPERLLDAGSDGVLPALSRDGRRLAYTRRWRDLDIWRVNVPAGTPSRYSGLRIGDAVALSRDRLIGNKLFLYTAKSGTHVYCPLPDFVVNALEAVRFPNEQYFFWTGESIKDGAARHYWRYLNKLVRLANVRGGHAHRFRDTFAVELLLSGVPLERVSVLLGHSSTRITEKHYAPWVKARQEQLLDRLPLPRGASPDCPYFFWVGGTTAQAEVYVRTIERTLKSMFRASGVPNAHSHRFRHTLATEILSQGGTIEDASNILGTIRTRSVSITRNGVLNTANARWRSWIESTARLRHIENLRL
jgi:integrase